MKKVIVLLLILCASAGSHEQEVYNIYEGIAPGSENWTDPEISVPAPWSGNRFLTWKEEGTNVAEWFQRHGVTGILLKYRTIQAGALDEIKESLKAMWPPAPRRNSDSTQNETTTPRRNTNTHSETEIHSTLQGNDGRRAITYVRQHAAELGVNPNKIGILGFSAGAMLSSNVILHDELSRPDFAAFIYGGGITNKIPDLMPLFICSPVNDIFPADDLFLTYQNWKADGVPAELHLIYNARHGDGLQYNGKEWNEWIDNLYNFMKAVEFVK